MYTKAQPNSKCFSVKKKIKNAVSEFCTSHFGRMTLVV